MSCLLSLRSLVSDVTRCAPIASTTPLCPGSLLPSAPQSTYITTSLEPSHTTHTHYLLYTHSCIHIFMDARACTYACTHICDPHPQLLGDHLALLQRAVDIRGKSGESFGAVRAHHPALHVDKGAQQSASPSRRALRESRSGAPLQKQGAWRLSAASVQLRTQCLAALLLVE